VRALQCVEEVRSASGVSELHKAIARLSTGFCNSLQTLHDLEYGAGRAAGNSRQASRWVNVCRTTDHSSSQGGWNCSAFVRASRWSYSADAGSSGRV